MSGTPGSSDGWSPAPGGHAVAGPATAADPGAAAGAAAEAGSAAASPPVAGALPADPAAYDSERAALARARGLSAPYIAGGRDPDPESGRREERFYGRLLVIMVITIVLAGFVLGLLGSVITALRGG
jgi:hypothetical protein